MNPDIEPMIYRYPIWDGILVDAAFDGIDIGWALIGVSILCGVPALSSAGWHDDDTGRP